VAAYQREGEKKEGGGQYHWRSVSSIDWVPEIQDLDSVRGRGRRDCSGVESQSLRWGRSTGGVAGSRLTRRIIFRMKSQDQARASQDGGVVSGDVVNATGGSVTDLRM
jgi:hypothetical protein